MSSVERILRGNSLNQFRLFFNRVSAEVGDLSKLQSTENTKYFSGDNSTTDFVLTDYLVDGEDYFVIMLNGEQTYAETDYDISDNGTDTTVTFLVPPSTGVNNIVVFPNIVSVLNNYELRITSNDVDIADLYSDLGLDAYNIANTTTHVSMADLADSIDTRLTAEIGLSDYNTPNGTTHVSLGEALDARETSIETDIGFADYAAVTDYATGATSVGGMLTQIEDELVSDIGLSDYNTPNGSTYASLGEALDARETVIETSIGTTNTNLGLTASDTSPNKGAGTSLGERVFNIDTYYETNLGDIETGSTIRTWWDGVDIGTPPAIFSGNLQSAINYIDSGKIGDTRSLRSPADAEINPDTQWATNLVSAIQQLYLASSINPNDPVTSTFLIKSSSAGDTMIGPLTVGRSGTVTNRSILIETDTAGNNDSVAGFQLKTNNGAIDWDIQTNTSGDINFLRNAGTGVLKQNGNIILDTTHQTKYFRTDQSNVNDLNFTFTNGRGLSLGSGYKDYAAESTNATYGGSLSGFVRNNKYIQVPGSLIIKMGSAIINEFDGGHIRSANAAGTFAYQLLWSGTNTTSTSASYYNTITSTRTGTDLSPNMTGASSVSDGNTYSTVLRSSSESAGAFARFQLERSVGNTQAISYQWYDGASLMRLEKIGTDGKLILGSISLNANNNTVTAATFSGNFSGNATSATKLASSRTFSLSGAVTATAVSFNGTAPVGLTATLAKPVKVYSATGVLLWNQNA